MTTRSSDHGLILKSFGALDIKDAVKGEVEAIVASLNVVDLDREVILGGAIPEGTPVKLSAYGHDAMFGSAPVGKGALFTRGDKVHFQGSFFLETTRGAEAFATAKAIGADQEWSLGFRILEAMNATEEWAKRGAIRLLKRLQPFEVSPVIQAASLNTTTLALKHGGKALELADAQAELAAIHARVKSREAVTEMMAMGGEVARAFARGVVVPEDATSLPPALLKFAEFAAHQLGISPWQMPTIHLVKALDDARDRGHFYPVAHAVLVRGGRDDIDIRRTIAHELSHAKEALCRVEHSEAFAVASAEKLLFAWSRHRFGDGT